MSQFKKGEDLEIYEMDYISNAQLQDVCDVRQPFLFNVRDIVPGLFSDISAQNIAKYGSHDAKLKDSNDYYGEQLPVDSISLPLHTVFNVIENDKTGHYFSEDNDEFLDESGLLKRIGSIDEILRPTFTVHAKHDVLFGSCNTATPLRYHTNYRQFLCVTSGKVRVKMTSWKSTKYLHPYKDYEQYEFRSPVHPIKPAQQYVSDYEKSNFLDFEVNEGFMLYLPPYWWYSIIYLDDPSTFVCKTTYSTIMNCISNLPDLALYVLQQQNITKKIHKVPNVKTANNEQSTASVGEITQGVTSVSSLDMIAPLDNNDRIQTTPVDLIKSVSIEQEFAQSNLGNVTAILQPENIQYSVSA
jgi:hypothetical protein